MEIRRITSNLPADLLAKAQEATGLGITETLVAGLEALLQRASFERMKKLQGKIHLQEDGGRKNGSSSH
jgi:hypothetical protein